MRYHSAMRDLIYLDHGATTPPDPAILRAMVDREASHFGNPNSQHPVGRAAAAMLAEARARLASLIGAAPDDVIFTGGGTEAAGLAILGSAGTAPGRVAISAVEHASVARAADRLAAREGWAVDVIPVDGIGRVTPDALSDAIGPETRIVAILLAHNEVGTINDLPALAPIVRRRAPKARLVVDAVQALGKIPVHVAALGADCVAFASHKLHGPKGIGALWSRVPLAPVFEGGRQEAGVRGGTHSGPLAMAFAEAAEAQHADRERIRALRDRLWAGLRARLPEATLTGAPIGPGRLPNNLHLCVPGLPGGPLLNALAERGLCASSGSACGKGRFSGSLEAMGRRAEDGAYIRLTPGRFTTEAEVDAAIERFADAVAALRALL